MAVILIGLGVFAAIYFSITSKTPQKETPKNRNVSSSSKAASTSSTESVVTRDVNGYYGIEADGTIATELAISKKQFETLKYENGCNYIFITDLHADGVALSKNMDESMEIACETLKKAVQFANENDDIDFIAIAGDNLDGYGTKEEYLERIEKLKACLAGCKKPIVFAHGNHDNNKNKGQNEKQRISNEEWRNLLLVPFNQSYYVYDKNAPDGNYFYFDIAKRKTRVIVLDCIEDAINKYVSQQQKWLLNDVFTITEEGWQYIVIQHYPILAEYYDEETTELNCEVDTILCGITRAINTKGTYNNKDYSSYKSHVTVVNYGHTHASYVGYDTTLNMFMANTGSCGFGYPQSLAHVSGVKAWGRVGLEITNSDKYLFDVFSATPDKLLKIRVGKGTNEEVFKNVQN